MLRLGMAAASGTLFNKGLTIAFFEIDLSLFYISVFQPALILAFLLNRIFKRKENPPYSFIFIFVGLVLWLGSALGSHLIPGILGHVEIVKPQKTFYEKPSITY